MSSLAPRPPRGQDNGWLGKVYILGAVLLLLGMLLLFGGCSPRIVEHIVVRRDTLRVVQRDSVWHYQHDSVFVKEKGDTIYKYVEHIRYRDRVKVDTLVRVRVDSVAVEREKVVEVEKPLSRWKSFEIGAFWYLCGAVLLLLAWCTRKLWLKLL